MMFKLPLDGDGAFLILTPRWSDFGAAWQVGLLALTILLPLLLILCLYRYELRLVSPLAACGTLFLRLLILLVILVAIAVQPHFAHESVDETQGRVRIAVDLSASMDVADRQRTPQERAALVEVMKTGEVDALTRKQITRRILASDGLNLLQKLAQRHEIEIVGFDEKQVDLQPEQLLGVLSESKAPLETLGTDLRQAFLRKPSSSRQPLLAVILFSDGQHNAEAPLDPAGAKAPIYPIAISSREAPSDLMIVDVNVKSKAFKDAIVPVEIVCRASNMPVQEMTIEMQIGGRAIRPEHRHVLNHHDRQEYRIKFEARMEEVGTHKLSIKATSTQGKEITLVNNVATRHVRVTEEKAKVLLVDGEARWEYHYLANALLRDSKIALDRVVFSQPRIGAIKEDDLEKAGLPKSKLPEPRAERKEIDPLLDYPCIILGDVSPDDLPAADRRRLLKYVGERGGTLILVAGKRYLPLAYTGGPKAEDDPLVKLLPITSPTVLRPEAGFALRPTSDGKRTPFLDLGGTPEADVWPDFPKHFWGIVGKRKAGASVLLTPILDSDPSGSRKEEDTGIFVQHDYGLGRVVFVGIDSTWRWRHRVGDKHHHRFWGQLTRWATAEELLPAGNRWVRFGAREPVYADGASVELAARLSASLPPLHDASAAKMKLYRKNADGSEKLIETIPLSRQPRQSNLFESKTPKLPPGEYRVEPDFAPYREQLAEPSEDPAKGGDLFRIVAREPRELLDLSTNWTLLENLASSSDGKLYTPENVKELLDRLERRVERTEIRSESKPWQDEPMVWWMLGVLLGLLTLEWGWRKWLDLP
jgi:hypothetical protein